MAELMISNRTVGNAVILDVVEGVDHGDGSDVGELVRAHAMAGRYGAVLELFGLPARLQGLPQMSTFITIFETFDIETDAARRFTLHREAARST